MSENFSAFHKLALTLTIALLFSLSGFDIAKSQSIEQNMLYSGELPGEDGQLMTALTVKYPPGGSTRAHSHGVSAFVFVISGHIRSQIGDEEAKVFGPGESWFEPAGIRHGISENASDTEPAEMLAVFVGTEENHKTDFE